MSTRLPKETCMNIFKFAAVMIAFGVALGGCTGGCSGEKEESEPENAVANRMKDPEYRKELDSIAAEQRAIMGKVATAREALEAAVNAEAAEETISKLKADLAAAEEELKASRAKAAAAVRSKVRQALAEDAARVKTAK